MDFTAQTIVLLLLAGLVAGLLPGTLTERRGLRLAGDIGLGVAAVFAAAWLAVAWHMASLGVPETKPSDRVVEDRGPNYEPVVLPLARLRPLLKPLVHRSREEVCDSIVRAAPNNDLPVHFFIRLLYQESTFRPAAISSAGALGIAQFMPETAADRRLDNPFDPALAIPASARLLRDHYRRFGNLGLAAAAYNAGPRRVEDWRAKKGALPQETQDYVKAITGFPLEAWTDALAGGPAVKIPQNAPCQEAAGLLAWNGPDTIPLPQPSPRVIELAEAKAKAEAEAKERAQERAKEKIREKARAKEETKAKAAAAKPKPETKGAATEAADVARK
jgi:hypothetical protein